MLSKSKRTFRQLLATLLGRQKNNHKSANGPLLFSDYYGIIWSFLGRKMETLWDTSTNKNKGKIK